MQVDTPTSYVRSVNDYSLSAHEIFTSRNLGKHPKFSSMIYLKYSKEEHFEYCIKLIESELSKNKIVLLDKYDMDYDDAEEKTNYSIYRQIIASYKAEHLEVPTVVEYLMKTESAIVTVFTNDSSVREIIKDISKKLRTDLNVPVVRKNIYYTIEQSQMGLELTEMDLNSTYDESIIIDNYNADFCEKVNPIINDSIDLNKRGLILLHGIAGSGKTNYIKQLIAKGGKRKIVYIPPSLAVAIANPSFIALAKTELKDSTIIVEDAESVLLQRGSSESNRDAVSNLLNITDGILADSLNLLVICTFNADTTDVDSALKRKGRLILEYKFDELTVDKADKLAKKLHGEHVTVTKPMSLADVYGLETEQIRPAEPKKQTFGFIP